MYAYAIFPEFNTFLFLEVSAILYDHQKPCLECLFCHSLANRVFCQTCDFCQKFWYMKYKIFAYRIYSTWIGRIYHGHFPEIGEICVRTLSRTGWRMPLVSMMEFRRYIQRQKLKEANCNTWQELSLAKSKDQNPFPFK